MGALPRFTPVSGCPVTKGSSMFHLKKWVPFLAFLIFGSIAVLLWQNQNRHDRELLLRQTETSSEQIRIRIEGLMNSRMAALELLAERWVERVPPDFSQDRFFDFAEMFYSHYPGFMGINWIDPAGVVRWVFPKNSDDRIVDTPIFDPQDPQGYKKIHTLHKGQKIVTPCMELIQGGLGYNTFFPLIYSGKIQGYLNGVFKVEKIVDICLAKEIFNDFWIRLFESDRLIFTNEHQRKPNPGENLFRVFREIKFPGKTWKLDLVPKSVLYPSGKIRKLSVLIFSLLVSGVLSLLLHLLLQQRRSGGSKISLTGGVPSL